MTDIEAAALKERDAEQNRTQAEAAWRAAWWTTTRVLAEPAEGERQIITNTLDIAERILGQSRKYLLMRRATGLKFRKVDLPELGTLPPTLATDYIRTGGDPSQAVDVVRDAETRGLSVREFAAELGLEQQHQPPATAKQLLAMPAAQQAAIIRQALQNTEVATAYRAMLRPVTSTPSILSPTKLDLLLLLGEAKDAIRRAFKLDVSLNLAGDGEVLSDLVDVETEIEQFRKYHTGITLDEALARIMEGN